MPIPARWITGTGRSTTATTRPRPTVRRALKTRAPVGRSAGGLAGSGRTAGPGFEHHRDGSGRHGFRVQSPELVSGVPQPLRTPHHRDCPVHDARHRRTITAQGGAVPDSSTTWSAGDWQLFQDKVRWAVAQGLETIPAGDAIAQMGESFVGTPVPRGHPRGARPRAPHRQPARARLRHLRGNGARPDEVRAPGSAWRPSVIRSPPAHATRATSATSAIAPVPSPGTPAACTTSPTGWPRMPAPATSR